MALFYVSEFPGCCGAKIIHELPFDTDNKEEHVQQIKKIISGHSRPCFFFATLNEKQCKRGVEELLLECGFEIIGTALNKNTYNKVRAYVYIRADEVAKRDPNYKRPW